MKSRATFRIVARLFICLRKGLHDINYKKSLHDTKVYAGIFCEICFLPGA